MPESEIFRLILQGGSFALLAVAFLWAVFRGVPMLRESWKETTTTHAETIKSIVTEFRAERKEDREYHAKALDKLTAAIDRLAGREALP